MLMIGDSLSISTMWQVLKMIQEIKECIKGGPTRWVILAIIVPLPSVCNHSSVMQRKKNGNMV